MQTEPWITRPGQARPRCLVCPETWAARFEPGASICRVCLVEIYGTWEPEPGPEVEDQPLPGLVIPFPGTK